MDKYKIATIVLGITQVLSVLFFVYALSIGGEMIELELKCAEDTCFNVEGADYYLFDDYSYLCQCIDSEDNIIYQEVLE